jgi:hypothetical protein
MTSFLRLLFPIKINSPNQDCDFAAGGFLGLLPWDADYTKENETCCEPLPSTLKGIGFN